MHSIIFFRMHSPPRTYMGTYLQAAARHENRSRIIRSLHAVSVSIRLCVSFLKRVADGMTAKQKQPSKSSHAAIGHWLTPATAQDGVRVGFASRLAEPVGPPARNLTKTLLASSEVRRREGQHSTHSPQTSWLAEALRWRIEALPFLRHLPAEP